MSTICLATSGADPDPRDAGLSHAWLVFGFAAQAVFGLRFLIQWIASERAQASVVPRGFWVLSLLGGLSLLVYFVRRGDPVGMAGQIFGVIVYSRNLYLLERQRRRREAEQAATLTPGFKRPAASA
jgi:lipid-A-disaccharide synthase-like uncharacterized protein